MIKIYRPINDTWIITTENFQKLFDLILTPTGSYRMVRNRDITKFSTIFEDIHYGLRFGFSNLNDGFYLDFSFYAGRASANIQISFENTEITYIFEDHSTQKRTHSFPSFDEQKMFVNGKFEIKIKGMFVIERNNYPIISTISNKKLWERKEKDFEIIVAFGKNYEKTVKIHKELLIAQSEYFEGMFRSGMKETITNTLKIVDFDFKTVNSAVQFFYGQQIPDSTSIKEMFELLRFADKYFIEHLRDYITTFIFLRLMPANVVEISNAIVSSNFAMKLREHCSDFLVACFDEKLEVKNIDILNEEFTVELAKNI